MRTKAELKYDLAKTFLISLVAIVLSLSLALFSAVMAENLLIIRILALLDAFAFVATMFYFRKVQFYYSNLKKKLSE